MTPPGVNHKENMNPDLKLCYVDDAWAYFTTQALADQWGDDWDDAPYEHNAGEPYKWDKHDEERGRAPWEIVKIAWDSPKLETPAWWGGINSRWSVEQINAGDAPWLLEWPDRENPIKIMAGVTVAEFAAKVEESGGVVYYPSTMGGANA